MANMDDIEPRGGKDNARIEDLMDIHKFVDGDWVTVRLVDSVILPISTHWIPIISSKQKKEVKIPRICLNVDFTTGKAKDGKCPYCEIGDVARAQDHYYMNAIIRDLQEAQPKKVVAPNKEEAKSGFKDLDSKSWTPVRVIRMPGGLLKKIKNLKDLNKVKNKSTGEVKTFPVNHPKYGVDINVMYDSKAKGGDKYQLQKEGRTVLDEDELEYLKYDLDAETILEELGIESLAEARKNVKSLEIVGAEGGGDDEDEDDEDAPPKRSSKSKAKPAAKKGRKDEDEDDEDLDDDDEDLDDEDDAPKKSRSKKTPAKKSRKDEDDEDLDDEDEDEDLDEDDDEPAPRRGAKGKAKPAAKKGRRPHPDDDEDEDEDLDDDDADDEEDDEPAPRRGAKGKSKPAAKKSSRRGDDDDEDLDDEDGDEDDLDDDEDEDDDPPPRRGAKSKAKPAAKKKRSRDDDDDDIPF